MIPGYQHEDMWIETIKTGKRYSITNDSENGYMLIDRRSYFPEPVANEKGDYELTFEEAERMFERLEGK